jgi:L-xylulokinase
MTHWLGLDCGGTLIKAGIYDDAGRECAVARRKLETISPHEGWLERDMHELWRSAATVIREALAHSGLPASAISGVGISAQGKGLYLLDHERRVLRNGMLSSDQRALDIVRAWQRDGIAELLYRSTLQTLWTGHPVSLLRWLKLNDSRSYERIGHVLMAHDYLRFCLTGEIACEETNISESNLYSMRHGDYDASLAETLGIGEIVERLPRMIGSSEVAGEITQEAAALTGLAVGTPVVGGLFDVVSTALCAGVVDASRLNAVMGTWSVTTGVVDSIQSAPGVQLVHGRHAEHGQYIIHAASPTSAANLEWVTTCFGAGASGYAHINDAIGGLPKATSSLLFLPFLFGSNAGLGMKGAFYGMQALHGSAHMLQAVYEGVVFSHYQHLLRMQRCFTDVAALRVTGGPARSPVWMQMLADISGLPLELPAVEETGCLGAAMAASVGLGLHPDFKHAIAALDTPLRHVDPDPAARAPYLEKYERYQALIDCLRKFEGIA